VKYGSAGKCQQKFKCNFHDERVPSRQTIHKLVSKLRTMGLLTNKKAKHKCHMLTEEKLDAIGARLEHTSRKSLKCLAQETGVSKFSARMASYVQVILGQFFSELTEDKRL
jgi:transposase